MKKILYILGMLLFMSTTLLAQMNVLDSEKFQTNKGALEIKFVGHGSLIFLFNEKYIYVDPSTRSGFNYDEMPKADLILITHEHGDHYDKETIAKLLDTDTKFILTPTVYEKHKSGKILKNGESTSIFDIAIEAIPAYNINRKRSNGSPFHGEGIGNGYILSFGNKKVYVGGDTEFIPEMKELKNIDIAFLPMNLPYTMTPAEVAEAAKAFKPGILYPYHYGKTNTQELVDLLKDVPEIKVVIKKM